MASTSGHSDNKPAPHVGIVGAGLAGLRCADILLQKGFQVTIIEGRDRTGGRLYQEKLQNGSWVDMGPNWIHGASDNPLMDIARQTATPTQNFDELVCHYDDQGKLILPEEAGKLEEICWTIVGEGFMYSRSKGAAIDKSESLADFFHSRLEELIPPEQPDYEMRRKKVIQLAQVWGSYNAASLEAQSLRFFWLEESIEGDDLFCAGTYKKVMEAVAKPALSQAEILFNSYVEGIEYGSDSAGEKVQIQIRDGRRLQFDQLVVTAPLGWLKHNLHAFKPSLPPRVSTAIQAIGYGNLEKVYISFPKAFWYTDRAKGDRTEGFIQWYSPTYAPAINPNHWRESGLELGSLPEGFAHPTILFYLYGDQSAWMVQKLAEINEESRKAEFLYSYFKPYYSLLPGYQEGSPDCTPTGCKSTDWQHDDLAGNGSYSNFIVGLEEGDKDIEVMREGLPEQRLWIAGEHTAPFVALGTATGAYISGEAVAKRIGEVYGDLK